MVEADDDGSVGYAACFEQFHRSIDREVRPLGLLDLDKDPHLLAPCPINDLREGWNTCSGKSRIKAGSSVEAANLLQSEVGGEAAAVRGAVERSIVKHDRLAFGGQYDVDLDRRRAPSLGSREGRQRIL